MEPVMCVFTLFTFLVFLFWHLWWSLTARGCDNTYNHILWGNKLHLHILPWECNLFIGDADTMKWAE